MNREFFPMDPKTWNVCGGRAFILITHLEYALAFPLRQHEFIANKRIWNPEDPIWRHEPHNKYDNTVLVNRRCIVRWGFKVGQKCLVRFTLVREALLEPIASVKYFVFVLIFLRPHEQELRSQTSHVAACSIWDTPSLFHCNFRQRKRLLRNHHAYHTYPIVDYIPRRDHSVLKTYTKLHPEDQILNSLPLHRL